MNKTKTILTYRYRDASNYKSATNIYVEGLMTGNDMLTIMEACTNMTDLEFVPEAIGLPLERPGEYDEQDDHPYAYFHQIPSENFRHTDDDTIEPKLTLQELLDRFKAAAGTWDDLAERQLAARQTDTHTTTPSENILLTYLAGPARDPALYENYAKALERSGTRVLNLLTVKNALPMDLIPESRQHHIENLLLTLCDAVAVIPGHETDLTCSRARVYATSNYLPIMELRPKILED